MPEFTNNNLIGSIVKDLHTRKARLAKAKRRTAQEEFEGTEACPVADLLDKAYNALAEGEHEAACDTLKELAHHLEVADEVSFDTEVASEPEVSIEEETEEEPSDEMEDESPMEEHEEE